MADLKFFEMFINHLLDSKDATMCFPKGLKYTMRCLDEVELKNKYFVSSMSKIS